MVQNGIVTRPVGGQITLQELATLLGVPKHADGYYYIEDICTALAINIWAKFKPVRHWSDGNLTLAQRQEANFGFDLSDYGGASSNEIATVFAQARANQGAWIYLRPRGAVGHGTNPGGSDEWFRILDFENYNHNALAPYSTEPPTRPNVHEVKLIDVHENPDAEIKLSDLDIDLFDDLDPDHVYVYLLFREYTLNPAEPIQVLVPRSGVTPISELIEIVGHSAVFQTLTNPAQQARNATWEVVGVASGWNADMHDPEEMEDFTWLYIPGTWQTFTINDQSHFLDLVYYVSLAQSFTAIIDTQSGTLSLSIDLNELAEDTGDTVQNIVLHLELTYRDSQGYRELLYSNAYNGGAVDDYDSRRTLISASGINIMDVPDDVPDHIDLRLWYEYTVGDEDPYVYKRYFELSVNAGGSVSFTDLANVPYAMLVDLM